MSGAITGIKVTQGQQQGSVGQADRNQRKDEGVERLVGLRNEPRQQCVGVEDNFVGEARRPDLKPVGRG